MEEIKYEIIIAHYSSHDKSLLNIYKTLLNLENVVIFSNYI